MTEPSERFCDAIDLITCNGLLAAPQKSDTIAPKMVSSTLNLTHQFLIAMPMLADPNFHRTVTYLCHHDEDGAMGIVINRPLDLNVGDMLDHMDIDADKSAFTAMPVLQGGPVQTERGFVIHRPSGQWDSVLPVQDDIGVATSRDILTAIAKGEGPQDVIVALGYAGWGAGQLERELADNAWLSGPVDSSIIFEQPYEQRWTSAAQLLGINPTQLSGEAGHS